VVKKKADSAIRDALKVRTCKASIRPFLREEKGKKVYSQCGKEWLGTGPCPNKDVHLLPIKTGFCSNGWCEGSKATDWRGRPAPTCQFYVTCPCKCHDDLDRLFAMTESERILVETSGYVAPARTYWMPSDEPDIVLSSPNGTTTPVIIESPAPDRVPASMVRDFGPTPTGRAARGELESWVKHHCDIWLVDEPGEPCTPSYLAAEISHDQGITPPSVGAISAVFERWVKLGFAVVEKKPTRFVRYTEDGIKYGLEKMKSDAKRRTKLQLKDDRRNLRR
jgi:hypothetical protein